MRHETLNGWFVDVKKRTVEKIENGKPFSEELTALVFVERSPPTGNSITWEMNRATKDELVRKLTGGIVLHSGELPSV